MPGSKTISSPVDVFEPHLVPSGCVLAEEELFRTARITPVNQYREILKIKVTI